MNLGLYVGSFNPVHKDHITIVKGLLKNKVVDKVLLVATKNYWDKNNLIELAHRIKMLKYFADENILIDEKRNHLDYTYQVIADVKKEYPAANIFLIIGADNVEKFHLWKNVKELLQNKIIVIGRDGLDVQKYINNYQEKNQFIVLNNLNTQDISATTVREKIKNQESVGHLLDNKIIMYIQKAGLYGGK